MRLRLTFLGFEIFCLEQSEGAVEDRDDDDLSITKADVEKMVDQIRGKKEVGGGQSIETDRDTNAPIPGLDKDYDSWADRPFGFTKPGRPR